MDISQLDDRLDAIERRLSRLEQAIELSESMPEPEHSATPSYQAPPYQISTYDFRRRANPLVRPLFERAKSGNWLGIVAVVCFVLAAGFIIKLSIDSGWLTPERQIGLAALFGGGLIVAGFALLEKDREYASYLPGAGVIVLYATTFAAHRLYSFISFETALGATACVSALCVWLYTEIRHDIYPLTAAIGAYVAPVVLGFNSVNIFSIYYFVCCSFAFALISIWIQSRILTMVAAYLAILMTAVIGVAMHRDELTAAVLAIHFLIFATGTYLHTKQTHHPLAESEAWAFFPVLLIFYAMEYHFINRIQPGVAPWISLGFAAVLIGLYISAKNWFPDKNLASQPMIFGFVTLVIFHSAYLELLPSDVGPWLFVLILLGFPFLPMDIVSRRGDGPFRIPILAVMVILGIEYCKMIFNLLSGYSLQWIVVSMAAFASIWILLTAGREKIDKPAYGKALLAAAHLLAILGFYQITTAYGSLAVSATWLLYAICVIVFAFARQDEVMAKSALFVLGFAAGKALLYDAASAPTVVRILCLLLTGAVLYGAGFLIRKISEWKPAKSTGRTGS